MCANNLRLINKNKRKQKSFTTPQQTSGNSTGEMLYGAGDDKYPWSGTQFEGISKTSFGTPTTDFDVRIDGTAFFEGKILPNQKNYMDQKMNAVFPQLSQPKEFEFLKKNEPDQGGFNVQAAATEDAAAQDELLSQTNTTFDPRIIRFDAFKSNYGIVPFGSETASSIYFDMVFAGEKAVFEGDGNLDSINTSDTKASDKIAPNKQQVEQLQKDPNMYGAQSLMNPYSVTRLVGGITLGQKGSLRSNMYDVRDNKRFYDNAGAKGGAIIEDQLDFTSIGNPTVTNIITWSNKDSWGRTPYSFQDFAFCKWWNIIPNNRLITLRKYAVPTYDNLNFPNMYTEDRITAEDENPKPVYVSPIATVVTYFGGESANKLNDFMKFVTGTKWKDINTDIYKVDGEQGSNPRAVIDDMFTNSGFGGVNSTSNVMNPILGKFGGLTAKAFSFAKFTGLLQPNAYEGHNQAAFDKLTSANIDPMDSLYSNKIIGPVNRIQSVKARDAGIEFSQSFNLVCEYVARPIGGVNTKAAMLDILANCLEVGSADAVFWGGGYRFQIHPSMYPFKREDLSGTVMDSLYAGKIFGKDGAIQNLMDGVREFGKNIGNSDWSNVTSTLGNLIGDTLGTIGNIIQSVSSSLFGEKLPDWFKIGDAENGNVITEKLKSYSENLNAMWKDQVIQETMMPNIQGMKALLTGEPTGNWHMTVGNPLNPILVIGNLICTKMDVQFGEEIGPDDFPLEMKVTYTLEHAMARDNAGIQSMFNRGAGKIYKLPDYVRAISDYESKVDDFTGRIDNKSWVCPKYINAGDLQQMTYNQSNLQGAPSTGNGYFQTYKVPEGTTLQNQGNADTTFIAKFTPVDPQRANGYAIQPPETQSRASAFLDNASNVRAVYYGNLFTQKWIN